MKGNKRSSFCEDLSTRLGKGRRRRRSKKKMSPTIFTIPNELITDVVARVASSSIYDFFGVKLSCKGFYQIANDKYILQRVSLDNFPIIPWHKSKSAKQSLFLEECKKSGHPEALYKKGVVDYFSFSKEEEGLICLRSAAKAGHLGASYVLGVILLCKGLEVDQEQEGKRLLNYVRSKKGITESRGKLKEIMNKIWRNNNSLKPKINECPMQDQHRIRKGWPSDYEDVDCEACRCDLEVTFVCNLVRGIVTY